MPQCRAPDGKAKFGEEPGGGYFFRPADPSNRFRVYLHVPEQMFEKRVGLVRNDGILSGFIGNRRRGNRDRAAGRLPGMMGLRDCSESRDHVVHIHGYLSAVEAVRTR